jgi:hypothetical protein
MQTPYSATTDYLMLSARRTAAGNISDGGVIQLFGPSHPTAANDVILVAGPRAAGKAWTFDPNGTLTAPGQVLASGLIRSSASRIVSLGSNSLPSFACWDSALGVASGMWVGSGGALGFGSTDGNGVPQAGWVTMTSGMLYAPNLSTGGINASGTVNAAALVSSGAVNGASLYISGNGTVGASLAVGTQISVPTLVVSGAASIGSNLSVGGWIYFPGLGNHAMGFGWYGAGITSYVDGIYQGWLIRSNPPIAGQNQIQLLSISANGNGNVYATYNGGQVIWPFTWSDEKLKSNIVPCAVDALALINAIPVYSFDMTFPLPGAQPKHWDCGIIAHEVGAQIPNAYVQALDENGYDSVNDLPILATVLRAVQQLSDRVTTLEGAR